MGERVSAAGVVVACMSAAHRTKRAHLAELYRETTGMWRAAETTMFGLTWGTQMLDESDEPISRLPDQLERKREASGRSRRHFEFKCPLCGRTVPARGERLDAVLDQLWADATEKIGAYDGALPVPLDLLAARLRGSSTPAGG